MIEIKPEDLIISIYSKHQQGGMHIARADSGVRIYHKPSNLDISLDKHRSQFRNRNECMIILQDMLTPFKSKGIIVSSYGLGEVTEIEKDHCLFFVGDGSERYADFSLIAHTEEGYEYKREVYITKKIKELTTDYQDKVNALRVKWGLDKGEIL